MSSAPLTEADRPTRPVGRAGPSVSDGVPLGVLPAFHANRLGASRAAVRHDGLILSWGELEARANRRARALAASGVAHGDFVLVALPNGIEFYETTFALWKLGATPTVASPKLTDPEFRAIAEAVGPKLAIGPDPSRLPGIPVLPAGSVISSEHSTDALPERVSPSWKAITSGGSTGRPKVIVDRVPGRRDPGAGWRGQQAGDVVLNAGPLYHNAPFLASHCALFVGGEVIEMGRFDAVQWLRLVEAHRVTWVTLVPTMMSRIWNVPDDVRAATDLSSLRYMIHMAAACPAWLKRAWLEWLGADRIDEVYAGTERIGATLIGGRDWLQRPGSVGRPVPGTRMIILNSDGERCEPGEVGEIYFLPEGGRGSTYSYIGAEAKHVGEWESLGDLGCVDEEGYLYLADRRTDLIVSGGVNLYPAEIEAAIELCPGVVASVVIGLPDADLGQRVHAIIQHVPGRDGDLSAEGVRGFLEGQLAPFKMPRSFEFCDTDLRDDAGKTRRSAFRDERLGGGR